MLSLVSMDPKTVLVPPLLFWSTKVLLSVWLDDVIWLPEVWQCAACGFEICPIGYLMQFFLILILCFVFIKCVGMFSSVTMCHSISQFKLY
jgi:hypothetical protein